MSYEETLKELFKTLAKSLKYRITDDECPPAVYKEAREFLKDNSITKENLDVKTLDQLTNAVPLEEFDDDGPATH